MGVGGDITWGDSKWQGLDEVNLSGIMFQASTDSLQHSLRSASWTANRKFIAVGEFQKKLIARYGSLIEAWHCGYHGLDGGFINFTTFISGCKAAGYRGDVTRLWNMLDEDGSGEISFNEVAMDLSALEVKQL